MRTTPVASAWALLLLVSFSGGLCAQAPPAGPSSARECLDSFRRNMRHVELDPQDTAAWERALACLDLSKLPEGLRQSEGRALAKQLYALLPAVGKQAEALLPSDSSADPYPLYRDPGGPGTITLDRVKGSWLFTAESLDALPQITASREQRAKEAESPERPEASPTAGASPSPEKASEALPPPQYQFFADRIRARLPESFLGKALGLEYWQWIGLGALVLFGLVLDYTVLAFLLFLVVSFLKRRGNDPDLKATRIGLKPFGWLSMAGLWWGCLHLLGLPARVSAIAFVAIKSLIAVAVVWAMYRVVDIVCDALARQASKTDSKFDDLLVPLLRKTLKFLVVVFGVVFIAESLDISVSSLLAGLGLGGLAFALAAQDTVKNFFGSITVVLDRPFEPGDWVLINGSEGSVEELGFRSTRIRTFYNSVITIPNVILLTAVVDNMGKRRYRRWKTNLQVTYDTSPDQLEAFCEGIRELVRAHPATRKDYFQVWVNGLGDSAIEIMLYLFFETKDWDGELAARERLILDILRLAQRLEVQMAFPTQTLHWAESSGPQQGGPAGLLSKQDGRAAAAAVVKGRKPSSQSPAERAALAAPRLAQAPPTSTGPQGSAEGEGVSAADESAGDDGS